MNDPNQGDLPLSFQRRDRSEVTKDSDLMSGMIQMQLRETRRITIGRKGDEVRKSSGGGTYRLPISLDYIQVTLRQKDEADNFIVDHEFHKTYGLKPRSIPISFMYERPGLNCYPFLAVYAGRQAWCKGNGREAMRFNNETEERDLIKCPCELLDQGKCKPHLVLSARLPGMAIGEIAKFRTTSKRSISYILSGMKVILEETAAAVGLPWEKGLLAKIPLQLKLEKETVTDREGKIRTIPTVGISFSGTDEELDALAKKRIEAYRGASSFLKTLEQQKQAEIAQAPRLLAPEDAKTVQEIVGEFHPENVDDVTSIDKIRTSRDFGAEAKVKETEKRQRDEVLREEGFPDAIRKALESVSDDLLGEGDELEPPRQAAPPQKTTSKRIPSSPPPPPPPPPKKPAKPKKDESFL